MAIYKRDMADINLETGNIHRTFLNHTIGYKDQKADHFGIRVFRDGEPVDLTGVSVQGVFMPPQGDPIAITSGNIVSGNEAEVVLPQACYNYDGQFCLAIKLVDSNNSVTGTMRIVDGMVDNTHASGTVAPTSAVPTYQEILSTYDAMVAATAAANGAIAATYSSSSTYKVGDYCIHDGGLYRCTTAITTAEAWTSGHWTAAKIGPDVSDLKSAFDLEEEIERTGIFSVDTFVQGKRTAATYNTVTADSKRITTKDYYHVFPGDVLKVSNIKTGYKIAFASSTSFDSGWKTSDYTYTFEAEMYLFANVAGTANPVPDIVPSDFTVSIQIASKAKEFADALKDEADKLQTMLFLKALPFTVVDGKACKNAGGYTNNANWAYAEYTLTDETELYVTGFRNNAYGLYIFKDSSDNVISYENTLTGNGQQYGPVKIDTIPSGATKIQVNGYIPAEWHAAVYVKELDTINKRFDFDMSDMKRNSFLTRANLTSEDDCDNVVIPGTYAKSTSSTPAHWPFASNHSGRLNVYTNPNLTNKYSFVQVAFDYIDNAMSFRIAGSTAWKNWNYIRTSNTDVIIPTGAKIAIMGDSISTYEGYSESHSDTVTINGVSYPYRAPYYPHGDVDTVDETWWDIIYNKCNLENMPVVSSVSRSRYKDNQVIDSVDGAPAPWHPDRISRIVTANPDYIFLNLGVNDIYHWSDTYDTVVPQTESVDELDAMHDGTGVGAARTIRKLITALPSAKIIGILPKYPITTASYYPAYCKVCEVLEKVFTQYGVYKIIDLRKCGINSENTVSYSVDSGGTHPNAAGMAMIADYILSQL